MPRSQRTIGTGAAVLALLAPLALTGCSSAERSTPVVELEDPPTAQADLGGQLTTDIATMDASNTSDWPRACDLLKDTTVKAVFPQAKGVSHTPMDIGFALSRPNRPDSEFTVDGAGCTFTVDLPVGTLQPGAATVQVVVGPPESRVTSPDFITALDENLVGGVTALTLKPGSCSEPHSAGVQCLADHGSFTF